uniref:RecA family profile 1 domain-containing protein n=1 Tax=Salarias fasciatus TaxID=181472 RepID=A0A672HA65_SALFA
MCIVTLHGCVYVSTRVRLCACSSCVITSLSASSSAPFQEVLKQARGTLESEMNESGAQLLARLEARRSLKDIEPRLFPDGGGPESGEVVELFGTEGTGKTELLYHLLCRCVLPEAAGGLQVDVVFVDTDYSLDMLRLVSVLDGRLNAGDATRLSLRTPRFPWTGEPQQGRTRVSECLCLCPDEEALSSCLSRLLVVHCSSSSQLLLTLHFLETSLSARPGLSLLLIDSISAFYWPDRSAGGASVTKQEETLTKCSELLGRLLRDYRVTVFTSCHPIRRSGAGSSSDWDRPFLCRSWQRLVTHRLLCSRQEAAGGAGEQRRRQVFSVHCNSFKTKTQRSSCFTVTDGGVQFL